MYTGGAWEPTADPKRDEFKHLWWHQPNLALQIEAEFKKVFTTPDPVMFIARQIRLYWSGGRRTIFTQSQGCYCHYYSGRLEAILHDPRMLLMFSRFEIQVYDEQIDSWTKGLLLPWRWLRKIARWAEAQTDNHFKTALFSATVDDAVTNFCPWNHWKGVWIHINYYKEDAKKVTRTFIRYSENTVYQRFLWSFVSLHSQPYQWQIFQSNCVFARFISGV